MIALSCKKFELPLTLPLEDPPGTYPIQISPATFARICAAISALYFDQLLSWRRKKLLRTEMARQSLVVGENPNMPPLDVSESILVSGHAFSRLCSAVGTLYFEEALTGRERGHLRSELARQKVLVDDGKTGGEELEGH